MKSYLELEIAIILVNALLLSYCSGELKVDYEASPEDEDEVETLPEGNFDVTEEDDVLVLTRDNFRHVITTNEIILVEFYAPWCGHCKAFAPEYAKAATELKAKGIPIGKVDATVESELGSDYQVTGFPTIKLFKNGDVVETYSGPRSAEAVVNYMEERADPSWQPPPKAVVTLTSSNFSTEVQKHPLMLVEFYAPWCGHCKKLEPEYEAAAKDLKADEIVLAKVDATAETELANTYKVSGYPTLKIFRHGREFEYNGGRDQSGIVSTMREEMLPASQEMQRAQETLNRMSQAESSVVGFFSDKHTLYVQYLDASNELRGKITLLHTFNIAVAEKLGVPMDTVVVFRPKIYHSKYEEDRYIFRNKDGVQRHEIFAFIKKHSVPLVGHRTRDNMADWYSHRPLVVVYYDVNFSHDYVKATQIVRQKVLDVAVKWPGILFAVSKEEQFMDELAQLGLDDSGEDVSVGFWDTKKKYAMEPVDDFSSQDLAEFVSQVKAGKVEPYLKSQPIPKKQTGPVKVVVAKSFQQEVMEADKDVLLEFYAPWCGHCKKLEPTYKKLAKQLAGESLIVAKMDAVANDVPDAFTVTGFPTIVFIPAADKSTQVVYDGDRSHSDLVKFVRKQQTHEEQEQAEEQTVEEEDASKREEL